MLQRLGCEGAWWATMCLPHNNCKWLQVLDSVFSAASKAQTIQWAWNTASLGSYKLVGSIRNSMMAKRCLSPSQHHAFDKLQQPKHHPWKAHSMTTWTIKEWIVCASWVGIQATRMLALVQDNWQSPVKRMHVGKRERERARETDTNCMAYFVCYRICLLFFSFYWPPFPSFNREE